MIANNVGAGVLVAIVGAGALVAIATAVWFKWIEARHGRALRDIPLFAKLNPQN
jgi:hypothetical protein